MKPKPFPRPPGVISPRLVIPFALLLLSSSSGAGAECEHEDMIIPGLRLMTFNVADPPWPAEDPFAVPDGPGSTLGSDARAEAIAKRLLEDEVDVIVIQESCVERAQKTYVRVLQNKFPHFLQFLDGETVGIGTNDSCLMLFSKWRFEPLDVPGGDACDGTPFAWDLCEQDDPPAAGYGYWREDWIGSLSLLASGFNAWAYADADAPDVHMAKSFAMFKIRNECEVNRPFIVATTHLQSTEGPSCFNLGRERTMRRGQMKFIREALRHHVSDAEAAQRIFVAGDLNLERPKPGERSAGFELCKAYPVRAPFPKVEGPCDADCTRHRGLEWSYHLGHPPSATWPGVPFARCDDRTSSCKAKEEDWLIDTWKEMPQQDRLVTNSGANQGGDPNQDPVGGSSVDYILHNGRTALSESPDHRICMQWTRRGLDYYLDGYPLSDHLPLVADFSRPAPRCSPNPDDADLSRRPADVPFTMQPGEPPVVFDDPQTRLTHRGSMQWYRISDPVALRIRVSRAGPGPGGIADGAHALVYRENDLSTPLAPFAGECFTEDEAATECTYVLPEPPYYVRVYGTESFENVDGFNGFLAPQDRTVRGGYVITFDRLDCSSQQEACPLVPTLEMAARFPPNQAVNAEDTLWFRLLAGVSGPAEVQETLRFRLHSPLVSVCSEPAIEFVFRHDSASPAEGWSKEAAKTNELFFIPGAFVVAQDNGAQRIHYATLRRRSKTEECGRDLLAQELDVAIRFVTDRTWFDNGMAMQCLEERTGVGNDDVAILWKADLEEWIPPGVLDATYNSSQPGKNDDHVGWFDEGSSRTIVNPRGAFASFTRRLVPYFYEDVEDDEDYYFQPKAVVTSQLQTDSAKLIFASVPLLDPEVLYETETQSYDWWDEAEFDGEWEWDAHYRWTFRRQHVPPQCGGSNGLGCPSGQTCQNLACR